MGEFSDRIRALYKKYIARGKDQEFKRLLNDKERFSFIIDDVQHLLCPVEKEEKSCENFMKYKELGNGAYRMCKLYLAVEYYTDALRVAPQNVVCIGYSNRSAALYHLQLYAACIRDIDRAAANDSEPLKQHIIIRKIKSLIKCRKLEEAKALTGSVTAVKERDILCDIIKNIDSGIVNGSVSTASTDEDAGPDEFDDSNTDDDIINDEVKATPLPRINFSGNDHFPKASSAIKVKKTKEKGRYFVATQDIPIGNYNILSEVYNLGCKLYPTKIYRPSLRN